MIARTAGWLTEAILIALIVFSPWAFGAVHPPFELWVAYGVAAVLVLWAVRSVAEGQTNWGRGTSSFVVAGCLYALFLLACLQLSSPLCCAAYRFRNAIGLVKCQEALGNRSLSAQRCRGR